LQVFGGRRHHQLSDAPAAGEEDVVKRQLEQRGRDADIALEQVDLVLFEDLADGPEGRKGRGCVLAPTASIRPIRTAR
jgi:hypothetical protein